MKALKNYLLFKKSHLITNILVIISMLVMLLSIIYYKSLINYFKSISNNSLVCKVLSVIKVNNKVLTNLAINKPEQQIPNEFVTSPTKPNNFTKISNNDLLVTLIAYLNTSSQINVPFTISNSYL